MKSLKMAVLSIALLAVFGVANVAKASGVPLTENDVINTYVNAMTQGKVTGINAAFDEHATFSMLQGKKVVNISKSDMLAFFNETKGVQQNCTTSTSVIENNANNSIVRVDMQYGNHIRSNYVTMVNTEDGWKITDVYTIFK